MIRNTNMKNVYIIESILLTIIVILNCVCTMKARWEWKCLILKHISLQRILNYTKIYKNMSREKHFWKYICHFNLSSGYAYFPSNTFFINSVSSLQRSTYKKNDFILNFLLPFLIWETWYNFMYVLITLCYACFSFISTDPPWIKNYVHNVKITFLRASTSAALYSIF